MKPSSFIILALTAAVLLTGADMAAQAQVAPSPEAAEPPASLWNYRHYDSAETAVVSEAALRTSTEAPTLQGTPVSLTDPNRNEIFRRVDGAPPAAQSLEVELYVPGTMPDDAIVTVFARNWDFLWWQVRIENFIQTHGRGTVRFLLPLRGEQAAEIWQPVGHGRRWHTLSPGQLIDMGLQVQSQTRQLENQPAAAAGAELPETPSPSSDLLLLDMQFRQPSGEENAPDTPRLTEVRWWPRNPRKLSPLEIRMDVDADYTQPFDSEEIVVEARVTRPDGKQETLQGFYYADFSFRDPQAVAVRDLLRPSGQPDFRVRYTPRAAGQHTFTLTVRTAAAKPATKTVHIDVDDAPDSARGFVRVDPTDRRFLAFDSGEPFWGIGMNVRSPYDERYKSNVPFSQWEDEGLQLYRRLFPKYRREGINVVEVWMSSWWLALEWIPDDVGNHGLGWMNQYRAWMLDRIFQWAAENDLYIVLVFNNHGKFGEHLDSEWDRNPYNRKNGGFLDSATEFFDDERAFEAFERFARYTVARWGHHPNLLMWKLFTEIDLTGDDRNFYKKPAMARWHRRASRSIKDMDPFNHIITTHWMLSYKQINAAVAGIADLDVLTTDAYYLNRRNGVARCLALIREGTQFGRRFNKPLIVTEFGGSPHADSLKNLIKQAHTGVWTGFFCNAAVAPFFWWFGLTEEADLYGSTRALARFSKGEDRRRFQRPERYHYGPLRMEVLRNDRRFLAWAADLQYYFSDRENRDPATRSDALVAYRGLKPGHYELQFWDTRSGEILHRRPLSINTSGSGRISLPPFTRDIAFKIIHKPR